MTNESLKSLVANLISASEKRLHCISGNEDDDEPLYADYVDITVTKSSAHHRFPYVVSVYNKPRCPIK